MKNQIFILLILNMLASSLISAGETTLKLDTKGHTGLIRDIVITKDKDILTAGDDKTIRIWDRSGVEKRKILGQIDIGAAGSIYTIALSEDEKYLAVGGYLGKYTGTKARVDEESHWIRIHDYSTGKLHKVLKSHTNIINDLSFSDDGKYMISASADDSVKIWNVNDDFSLEDTITFHSKDAYGGRVIKKNGKYYVVTVSYDNKIALYDMQNRKVIKSQSSDYQLKSLAVSNPFGDQIATCGKGKEILIYDSDLNFVKKIKSETIPEGLAFSKDEKMLISGTSNSPNIVNIYNVNDNYSLKSTFKEHKNVSIAVGFLDNNTAVSTGGIKSEVVIWDVNTLKVNKKVYGVGGKIWGVGISGDNIAWTHKWTRSNGLSELQKSINLKTFNISNVKQTSYFSRISTINGNYTLMTSAGGDYGKNDAILNIQKDGQTKAKITRMSYDGYHHSCYGWYKDYVISAGSGGHIKVYSKSGTEIASLVGHSGEVWSIAVDGDRLVSGNDDQTIKVWDLSRLSNLDSSKVISPMLSIFAGTDDEWVVWSKSGYFNSSVGGDKYVGYHINQGPNNQARYVGSDKYFDTLFRPDIIASIWQTGSEEKAIAFASRTKKVKSVNVAKSLPPVVNLLSSSNIKTSKNSIEVKFSVSSKEDIKEIIIIHNGERINARGLKKKDNKDFKSVIIELDSGENIVSIKATNKFAMSDEVLVYATKTTQAKSIYKPTLYMLSIGVSKYKNSEYNLGVADKDAESMVKIFKAQKGKIYKDVVAKILVNSDASSDNILDGLDWIDKEATSKDVVIVFIAGHGVNDDKGTYYFLSHDANLESLRRSAVKWTEIQDTMSNLPSKVILIADTCHSGNITGTRRDITSAIKSIVNSGSGSVIMTATTGSGYSYEKTEWGHGAFTKSFIDGLGDMKADYDSDGTVTIKEIDLYVTSRVKELTKGKQKPTTIIPSSVPDFAIGVR
ncbi:WD-repeat containing protein [Sulfurimonas gotlandica GD1]|uniref:WD-repeat containing protein n=1 Tax=Sulfurimonas gotlandica (strain DSM 19862 / JCM 16533 / GD1) TaxID=929558 RepID=B6BNJ4_SULGG|nr:caspase family protein [Sulfurimonas gotlandica]EDZ61318.1 caspase domain protein [Sulfurimonas gotlandica GD1]EHP31067.1 WD-repeat containing protein [Sulfurimonas gotlandica GD1]